MRVRRARLGLFVRVAVIFALGVASGYVGRLALTPHNWLIATTTALGGIGAGVLLLWLPAEAWRLLRKLWLRLWIGTKRKLLYDMLLTEGSALTRRAGNTPPAEVLRDLAVTLHLRGEAQEAETELAKALELSPDDPSALVNLGVVLADQGLFDQAAETFLTAVRLDPLPEAITNLSLVAALVSSPERLAQMVRSLPAKPNAVALNNIGVAYTRAGDWGMAREWFLQAAQTDPGLPAAHANLGLLAFREGQLQEAADHVLQAERRSPCEPAFSNYLGVILAVAGQTDQACKYLRRAQRAAPADVGVRLNTLLVEGLEGHWASAARGLRAMLSETTRRADIRYNLAVAELAAGEAKGASVAAAAAIEEGDVSADAYTALATALWQGGRRSEALSHLQRAAEAPDAGPLAASNLGRGLLLDGEFDRALDHLQRAFARWPDDPGLAFDVATAILARGAASVTEEMTAPDRLAVYTQVQGSLRGFDAADSPGGELALEAHINKGLFFYFVEEYEPAAEQFELAIRAAPKVKELHFLAGTALGLASERHWQGGPEGTRGMAAAGLELMRRAIPHLEEAAEVRDVMADALHNLGACLYTLGQFDQALAVFRRALRLENSEQMNALAALAAARQARECEHTARAQLLMSEARREELNRRFRELIDAAVHYFRQALLRNELSAVLHANIGLAYMLRNQEQDVEAALRHWQRMRAIAGVEMERRYKHFSQIEDPSHVVKVQFDDRDIALRRFAVADWLVVPPARAPDIRWALEPVVVRHPWRLLVGTERLRRSLALRDRIASAEERLARLRM